MERFFRFRDRWGNSPAFWIVVCVVFTLPIIWQGLKQLRLENDITRWLPSEDPEAQVLDWFNAEFEHDSNLLFSWDSSTVSDPRIRRFQQALLGKAPGFDPIDGLTDVVTHETVAARMLQNGLDDQTVVDRLSGVLIGTGFLKVRLSESARDQRAESEIAIRESLEALFDFPVQLLPPVSEISPDETVPPESDEATAGSAAPPPPAIRMEIPPHDLQLRWRGFSPDSAETQRAITHLQNLKTDGSTLVEEAFLAPGAPIAVSISINQHGEDEHTTTLGAIRAAAIAVGIPEEEIRMGGTIVGRHRLSREARRAIWNRDYPIWNLYKRSPVLLSALVGMLSSFVMLRNFRLSVLVIATALYVCLAVLAIVPLTGRSLNVVLVVLPNLLLVLTMSGAIHLANYWKYARSRGEAHPVAAAIQTAWQPCTLASATTAIGMASLLTATLSPVREFGMFSSIGCLFSLTAILLLFPSLLCLWPTSSSSTTREVETDQRHWTAVGRWLVKHRHLINGSWMVLFLVTGFGLRYFQTETKFIRYFPSWTRIVQDYDYLEESLAGIVSLETIVRFDTENIHQYNILERMEIVRTARERMATHPWVSGTVCLADFRPLAPPPPAANASGFQRIQYNRRLQRTEAEIFTKQAEDTEQFTKHASQPLSVTLRGQPIEIHEGDEVWRIRSQASVTGDVDYESLTAELNQLIRESLDGKPGIDFVVTGMVPLFLRTQNAVLESLIESFALAFVIIALVMVILLRNVLSGLLAMLPNLFPVGVVFGLVAWAGIPVDIGTMITASVALGIAIDGTLHLLTWFQEGIRNGLSRDEAVVQALAHCGPAMWQTSIAISLGILMLAGADLLLIHRFGWLMAALIFMAMVADVILLPCLLAGRMGAIIAAGIKKPGATAEAEPPVPAEQTPAHST